LDETGKTRKFYIHKTMSSAETTTEERKKLFSGHIRRQVVCIFSAQVYFRLRLKRRKWRVGW